MTSTLKALENQGLVLRQQFNEVPPHVEYSLTESAKALDKVFQTMREWGNRYL
ncbi:MAG: winged helix-turn-helix transcriptional regulator [Anaerobutyricum hallii]